MKILAVVQGFQQGWGGAPESIRLMARQLAPHGFSFDVYDLGRFHSAVERLDLLPEPGGPAGTLPPERVGDYGAIIVAGPWQNPVRIAPVLKARSAGQPLYYLPRGGLARVDFARLRDLKKLPYLVLVERRLLRQADGIVFSSEHERDQTIRPARGCAPEFVIPDLFDAEPFAAAPESRPPASKFTVSFLAEISPLKGLLPLVEAFAAWSVRHSMADRARLVAGGRVRAGSESYFRKIEAVRDRSRGAAEIELVGPVPHASRAGFYAGTDLMALPSRGESFGLTLLEALSSGCASLASPNIGALQYVPDHDRLIVLEDGGASAIEAGLARAYADLTESTADERARTRDFARTTVAAINARAVEAWHDLLGRASPA